MSAMHGEMRMQWEWTDASITVRPVRLEDAEDFFEAAMESLNTVGRWFDWCHAELKLAECQQWFRDDVQGWADQKSFFFSVLDSHSGRYIGSAWLNSRHFKHPFANLGYWVRKSEERRGIALRAARAVATFGIERLGLQRIEIIIDVQNLPSQRLAEKLGAQREGLLRNRLAHREDIRSAYVYSLIPADLSGSDAPE